MNILLECRNSFVLKQLSILGHTYAPDYERFWETINKAACLRTWYMFEARNSEIAEQIMEADHGDWNMHALKEKRECH